MFSQYFSYHVIANVVSSMSHVAVWVHCRSTCVPRDVIGVEWFELLLELEIALQVS